MCLSGEMQKQGKGSGHCKNEWTSKFSFTDKAIPTWSTAMAVCVVEMEPSVADIFSDNLSTSGGYIFN